ARLACSTGWHTPAPTRIIPNPAPAHRPATTPSRPCPAAAGCGARASTTAPAARRLSRPQHRRRTPPAAADSPAGSAAPWHSYLCCNCRVWPPQPGRQLLLQPQRVELALDQDGRLTWNQRVGPEQARVAALM